MTENQYYEKVHELVRTHIPDLDYFTFFLYQNFLSGSYDKERLYCTGAIVQKDYMDQLEAREAKNFHGKERNIKEAWNYLSNGLSIPITSPDDNKKRYVAPDLYKRWVEQGIDDPVHGELYEYFKNIYKRFNPAGPRYKLKKSERLVQVKYFKLRRNKDRSSHKEIESDLYSSFPIIIDTEMRGAIHLIYPRGKKSYVQGNDSIQLKNLKKEVEEMKLD